MHRKLRLFLALFTGLALAGWTYLLMRLEVSGAWGDQPINVVRYTLYGLPYFGLLYDLLTCWQPNRLLCRIGLVLNLPGLIIAVAWFNYPNGILLGYTVLFYMLTWYAYAVQVLATPKRSQTMAPFKT